MNRCRAIEMNQLSQPFVSVIIPVFNDSDRLKLCLETLETQTYPSDRYEAIAVDNGSEDLEAVKNTVALFGKASLAYERIPSSYAARNKGVSLAKGEIIAFCDADCIPHDDWIERGVESLLSVSNCGLLGGKIELFFQDPDRLTPVELYEKFHAFPQQEFIEKHHYGATANVFTFKTVIQKIGGFAQQLKSTGDYEWGQRIYLAGYQQVYSDRVCVKHPARSSYEELKVRNRRIAGGIYDSFCQKKLSKLDFNKLFWKSLFLDAVDPLAFTYITLRNPKIESFDRKISISLTRFFIMSVRCWEKIRLKLGGVSARS
jgi:glycosyltransferase involved in cell wall biosynthesis